MWSLNEPIQDKRCVVIAIRKYPDSVVIDPLYRLFFRKSLLLLQPFNHEAVVVHRPFIMCHADQCVIVGEVCQVFDPFISVLQKLLLRFRKYPS